MAAVYEESLLSEHLLGEREFTNQQAECSDIFTGDGSVNLQGQPSLRSKSGGWKTCPFILATEGCERLAFYGINTNLVMYLTKFLHEPNVVAARNVGVWAGTGYLTPLIGAFVADAYLGRFKTITLFSTIYFLGLTLLALCASLPSLRPPSCPDTVRYCEEASVVQLSVFYLALYVIAFGMGGIKPCVSSFGADQFDDEHRSERKKKTHFFNWFYLSINLGSLIATTVLVYVQDNIGWSIGYTIPAVAMAFAIFCFLLGTPLYRHKKPAGSPLTRIAQVLVAALRKFNVQVPLDDSLLYGFHDKESSVEGSRKLEHTPQLRFLDKAATETLKDTEEEEEAVTSPWKLCSVSQVEEVKQVARVMPIWATTIFFSTAYAQMFSVFVEQGARMDTRLGPHFNIPPASLSLFAIITVLLLVPVYDRIIVKIVRRYTGHEQGFTQLQRMGIGLFVSIFAMITAAIVEMIRLDVAKKNGLVDDPVTRVPMSIFWQVPQIFLLGVAETFTYIGQLEFFYEHAPDSMRSLGTALALTTYGLGYYMNSVLMIIVTNVTASPGWIPDNLNSGHLDYFFTMIALLSMLNFVFYLKSATSFHSNTGLKFIN